MTTVSANPGQDLCSAPDTARVPTEVVEALPSAEWDSYATGHAAATAYHRAAWRPVFEKAFGHETVYLAARANGAVTGILPLVVFRSAWFGRFAVSLPFVDTGGVCADDEPTKRLLVTHAAALLRDRGLSFLELRHVRREFPDLPVRQHKFAFALPLAGDAHQLWSALDRKVRNLIRKAQKSELEASVGGAELLPEFYAAFSRNMRDLGTPVYARSFFAQVLEASGADASVIVVRQREQTVAAGITLRHRGVVAMPWAAAPRPHRHLCGNYLLYWCALERAIDCGATSFDFGRSSPGQGPYQFKQQWGAAPTPLHWEYCLSPGSRIPDLNPGNPRFRAAIATWKRLPLWLTRCIGPPIVRSLP